MFPGYAGICAMCIIIIIVIIKFVFFADHNFLGKEYSQKLELHQRFQFNGVDIILYRYVTKIGNRTKLN